MQSAAQGFDAGRGPVGEIGEGALANARALANTFAEEDGGRGVAIGDSIDVQGMISMHTINNGKAIVKYLHGHNIAPPPEPSSMKINRLPRIPRVKGGGKSAGPPNFILQRFPAVRDRRYSNLTHYLCLTGVASRGEKHTQLLSFYTCSTSPSRATIS